MKEKGRRRGLQNKCVCRGLTGINSGLCGIYKCREVEQSVDHEEPQMVVWLNIVLVLKGTVRPKTFSNLLCSFSI